MHKFILSLLLLLPLTYQAMDFTTLINGTYNETCPPCDCTDQTSSLIALGTIAGSFSFCYVVKKCLERRKTPAQRKQQEINELKRTIQTLKQAHEIDTVRTNQLLATNERQLQALTSKNLDSEMHRFTTTEDQPTDPLLSDASGSPDII